MTRRVENLASARKATVIDLSIFRRGRFDPRPYVRVSERRASDRQPSQNPRGQRDDILDAIRALKMVSKKGLILRAGSADRGLTPLRHGAGTAGLVTGFMGRMRRERSRCCARLRLPNSQLVDLVPIFFGGNAVPDDVSTRLRLPERF